VQADRGCKRPLLYQPSGHGFVIMTIAISERVPLEMDELLSNDDRWQWRVVTGLRAKWHSSRDEPRCRHTPRFPGVALALGGRHAFCFRALRLAHRIPPSISQSW
jgi:hypothetical protein